MNQTLAEENLTTADIANSSRPVQISNPENSTATDPNFPDIRPESSSAVEAKDGLAHTNAGDTRLQLFPDNDLRDLRSRWDQAQGSFVDEPRKAVEQADSLVASVVKRIAEQFADERSKLEKQWDRGDNVSTEDLRQALRRYRSFFDRLLSV